MIPGRNIACYLGFFLLGLLPAFSQPFIYDDYGPPLPLPLWLSGTFGEPREDHFHTGIDIRTEGITGFPVLAVADGYLARIRTSPTGYGKAIYIKHANGYTSVYAHLDRFSPKLEKYVRAEQYKKKSYILDVSLPTALYKFRKGDTIAYSGNTGGSGGPHLHFELRETATEKTVNPLLYGYSVADTLPPLFQGLLWYDLSNYYGKAPRIFFAEEAGNGQWWTDTLFVKNNTRLGLGWQGFDQQQDVPNKNGLYSLQMLVNGQPHFGWKMQKLIFDEGRYANCWVDYKKKKTGNGDVYQCFRLPGNRVSVLGTSPGNGILTLGQGDTFRVEIIAGDINNNLTRVQAIIIGSGKNLPISDSCNVWPGKAFEYNSPEATVQIPEGAFYDSLLLRVSTRPAGKERIYSARLQLHNDYVPMHRYAEIRLKPTDSIGTKGVIVHRDIKGKESAVKTKLVDGWYMASVRETGTYFLRKDTQKPVIKPAEEKEKLWGKGHTQIIIRDRLSGIDRYSASLDGKWILMEYDAKTDLLYFPHEEKLPAGEHLLKIDVYDAVGNLNTTTIKIKP